MEPKWSKNRLKKRSKNECIFWSLFWSIWSPNRCQNGAKLGPKSKPTRTWTRKGLNRLNISKHNDFSMISGFEASGFREKIDEKTMKERSRNGSGFWHRFFIDLGSIWEGFGRQTRHTIGKNIEKTTSKKQGPRGAKDPKRSRDHPRPHPFWPPGRFYPNRRANPPLPFPRPRGTGSGGLFFWDHQRQPRKDIQNHPKMFQKWHDDNPR